MKATATMKAVAFDLTSGKEKIINIEKPTPSDSEVLIHIKRSALDTATEQVLSNGIIGSFLHDKSSPLILGWHYVGTIEDIGANVSDLKKDDVVWGFLQYESNQKQGTFAEYITTKANECARAPQDIELETLAAASTETLTALQALRDKGELAPNESALILGAGGGVGSAAVQIAKQLGAHVTAVCSTKDVTRVKSFGADVVIDRSEKDIYDHEALYDVIFDTPSMYSPLNFLKKMNSRGCYVATLPSFGMIAGKVLSFFNGTNVSLVHVQSNRNDLGTVGEWLSNGKVTIDIDSTFSVKEMKNALERQGQSSKVGRVVINVEDGW